MNIETIQVQIRALPKEIHALLKARAAMEQKTLEELVVEILTAATK